MSAMHELFVIPHRQPVGDALVIPYTPLSDAQIADRMLEMIRHAREYVAHDKAPAAQPLGEWRIG